MKSKINTWGFRIGLIITIIGVAMIISAGNDLWDLKKEKNQAIQKSDSLESQIEKYQIQIRAITAAQEKTQGHADDLFEQIKKDKTHADDIISRLQKRDKSDYSGVDDDFLLDSLFSKIKSFDAAVERFNSTVEIHRNQHDPFTD